MEDIKTPSLGKISLWIFLGLIAVFVLALIGSALNLITIPWLKFDSKVNANRGIVQKTYSADNELYNYHWFQETAGDITALQQNIAASKQAVTDFQTNAGPRSSWGYQEEQEFENLQAVVLGQQQQYNSLVQTYNAKAGEADKSMFVSGLPLFFNLQ